MNRLLPILPFLVLCTLPAAAEDYVTPADQVPDRPGVKYADLLRQLIPDLDDAGSGHLPPGIRHIDGPDMAGETPETLRIVSLEVRTVDAEGRKTLWVLGDIGDGGTLGTYTLLAVFDDSGALHGLIDAVEVDSDRLTGFAGDPLRISRTDEAILVDSEHSNSSQSYQSETLLFFHHGKLAKVADFFAFGTRDCTTVQYESLDLKASPGGKGFWPITATVTRSRAGNWEPSSSEGDESPDCIEPEFPADFTSETFSDVYIWDEAVDGYRTTSTELTMLGDADQQMF
jgi:hypothetical protein